MAERIQGPKGTYDVLPEQSEARARVERAAAGIFGSAGYRRIETPIFEDTELFARGVGAGTDIVAKEMYTFTDPGERSLTLRPEGTAPVMRAYHEHGMQREPQPVKLWYLGPFFRRERPQAGRFRQFWQVGAEAIGSDDPAADAELICLLAELLDELGVHGTRLRIGTLGSPEARSSYRALLTGHLRANAAELSAEVRARIDSNPLRAFDSTDPGTVAVMASAPRLIDHLGAEDLDHFAAVRAHLDAVGLAYELDTTLVRGLDYYTRTLFEFSSDALGAQSGVGGGGRYDRLAEQLGARPTPGVGFAAGIERILLASDGAAGDGPRADSVDLYLTQSSPADVALAAQARRAGLSVRVELAGRSLKGALKQAARCGARHVVLYEDGETIMKDMETGEQEPVACEAIVARALKARHLS